MNTLIFGACLARLPRGKDPVFAIGPQASGILSTGKVHKPGTIVFLRKEAAFSPSLAALEMEMRGFHDRDPGPQKASDWLARARQALMDAFSKPDLLMLTRDQLAFLEGLKSARLQGWNFRSLKGAQSLMLVTGDDGANRAAFQYHRNFETVI